MVIVGCFPVPFAREALATFGLSESCVMQCLVLQGVGRENVPPYLPEPLAGEALKLGGVSDLVLPLVLTLFPPVLQV